MGNTQQEQEQQERTSSNEIEECIDTFKNTFKHTISHQDMVNLKLPDSFKFFLPAYISYAKYALEKDEYLAQMRAKLVPYRLKEELFWSKYFYLLQQFQSTTTTTTTNKDTNKNTNKKNSKSKLEKKEKEKEIKSIPEKDNTSFQLLLQKPSIWLYQIPTRLWKGRNNKAEAWNLTNPLWCGRMRIIAFDRGSRVRFQFLEPNGSIYLESVDIPLDKLDEDNNPIHHYFDAYGVVDSSRFFIIWVETPGHNKLRIPFGFGMREKQDAFDIRACINDQLRIVQRQQEVDTNELPDSSDSEEEIEGEQATKAGEFDLKDGESIRIGSSLHGTDQTESGIILDENQVQNENKNWQFSLTPPPPAVENTNTNAHLRPTTAITGSIDDEWGDFSGA